MRCQRKKFSLPVDVSYLNCAYMGPLLRSVEQIGREAVSKKSRPFEIFPLDFFTGVEKLKKTFARLVGCPDFQRIALIPSVSYGMATVIKNLPKKTGGNLVLLDGEFPSDVYPIQKWAAENDCEIRTVAVADGPKRGRRWNQKLLQSIDNQTVMVALGHVHWADGTKFDLEKIREKTRKHGAWLVVDGTQSVGALPFDVAKIQPEALICGGYKWLLGPYSMGCAYFSEAFDDGSPLEENWIQRLHSEDFRGLLNYQSAYQPAASRFSVGESSNFILVPMLTAAIEQLENWGVSNIQNYAKRLGKQPLATLAALGCEIEEPRFRSPHLVGVRFSEKEFSPEKLQKSLAERRVFVSFRGHSMRVSIHVWNDAADLQKLVACFQEVKI